MTNLVQFPGLGLSFELNRVAFSIGGFSIYWYGVCIAFGICLALVFAFRHSIEFGVDPDSMVDVILIGIVLGIVSARAYYVAMAPFKYENIWEMIAVRDGGLAIYGGIIGGLLARTKPYETLDLHKAAETLGMCDTIVDMILHLDDPAPESPDEQPNS